MKEERTVQANSLLFTVTLPNLRVFSNAYPGRDSYPNTGENAAKQRAVASIVMYTAVQTFMWDTINELSSRYHQTRG